MEEIILDKPKNFTEIPKEQLVYPTILTRVKAMILDYLVVLILLVITSSIIGSSESFPTSMKVVLFIAMFSYEPIFTSFGVTLGQLVMGIRVRDINDPTKKINIIFSFIRTIIKALLGWISFLAISFTGKRRALHDMAGMSIMVYHIKK